MGTFDHLEWTYDGAFEQLFGLGKGNFFFTSLACMHVFPFLGICLKFNKKYLKKKIEELEQKFSKNSNAQGFPGERGGCLSFDLTGT